MGGAGSREDAASYNYPHFDAYVAEGGDLADEAAFRDSAAAGQRAEDFTLPRLRDEALVSLSGLLRVPPLVMEVGSVPFTYFSTGGSSPVTPTPPPPPAAG